MANGPGHLVASNVRAHRITYDLLALRGAFVGVLAAIVMAIMAMLLTQFVAPETDMWSFPKAVSSIVLGEDAATPLTGFDAAPVIVGLLVHLAIGAVVGAIFATLIGLFDIEETVPVTLMGLIYGVSVFLFSYLAVGSLFFPAINEIPTIVGFWTHVAFGLIAGAMLGQWNERYDEDHELGNADLRDSRNGI